MPPCLRLAPGLHRRSYFGGGGSAGRPAALSPLGMHQAIHGVPFQRPQDRTRPFGQAQGMLFKHSLIFFRWVSFTRMLMKRPNI